MWSLLWGWSCADLQVVETRWLVTTWSLTFFWLTCSLVFCHFNLGGCVVVGFLWHVLHKLFVPCIVLFLRMLGNGYRIPGWSMVLPFCRSVKSSINVLDNVLAVPAFIHMLESYTHVKSDIPTAYHLCVCLLYNSGLFFLMDFCWGVSTKVFPVVNPEALNRYEYWDSFVYFSHFISWTANWNFHET